MHKPPQTEYLVPHDGSFRVKKAATRPPKSAPSKDECEAALAKHVHEISDLQRKLYADKRWSVLLVFQAIDAAGKDGTIRAVMTGINPAGCQVFAFKAPNDEELEHDFLWRIARALPERGRIGILNRSHYEEVLAVRVHTEFLKAQRLPRVPKLKQVWKERFESIHDFERHLSRNGTMVLKFWLNVSKKEQRSRLLERIDDPSANWKFQAADVDERDHWGEYMDAYENALNATSRPWAPWYAIPADDKPYMRMTVAKTIAKALRGLDVGYPELGSADVKELRTIRRRLERS